MIRTTCLLLANWKYEHHVYQKENNDKQHLFNQKTTPDKHTPQKKQTTNKDCICKNIQTSTNTKHKTQHTNNQKRRTTVQHENPSNTTEGINNTTERSYEQRGCCLPIENTYIILTRSKTNAKQKLFNRNTIHNTETANLQLTNLKPILYL